MAGFATSKRTGVAVSAGDRVSVQPFTLDVAGATETIKVTAEAPLIQSQSGERSFTITADAVENLPILNRTLQRAGGAGARHEQYRRQQPGAAGRRRREQRHVRRHRHHRHRQQLDSAAR